MRILHIMTSKRLRTVARLVQPQTIVLLIAVTPQIAPATGDNKKHQKSIVPLTSVPERAPAPAGARLTTNRVTIRRIANELDEPAEPTEKRGIIGYGVTAKRSTNSLTRGI